MTSMGLNEAEKNARVAEFAAFVDSKVSSGLAPSSQRRFKTRLSGPKFKKLSGTLSERFLVFGVEQERSLSCTSSTAFVPLRCGTRLAR